MYVRIIHKHMDFSDDSETCICWPPLILFKTFQLIQVVNSWNMIQSKSLLILYLNTH